LRRIGFFLTLGLFAFGLLGIGASAATSASGTTDPVTTYSITHDVRIGTPDGISLDSDEYVPDSGCPCPVIVIQTPYRKSGQVVGEGNTYYPSHGYAEIVVDVRGTGSSTGYWDSFGQDEQKDGVTIVNWAAHRPFSNGKIGLAGVSYSAINQFLTVEQLQAAQPNNNPVKAIFPIVPMSDPYRDVVFSGGNTDTGFIPLWLGLVNGLNAIPADDAQAQPAIALNAESQHLMDIAQFAVPAVGDAFLGSYEHMLPAQAQTFPDQAYDGPYYRDVAPLNHIENVHVPTFIVGGEYDIFQRGEPLLYRGLDLPSSQKKILYGPWYHGSPTANLTADDGTSPVTDQQGHLIPSTNNLSLAWFDHWLKGFDNGIQKFPTVETYQLGRNAWSADSSFPAKGTEYTPWYLDGAASGSGAQALLDGSLTQAAGASGSTQIPWQPLTGACSRSTTQWTAGIVKTLPQCETDNSIAEQSGASFTSAKFPSDYTVSGPLMADLWVSSTRADTELTATLTDVRPDGTSDRVTAGSLIASMGQTSTKHCGAKVIDCSLYIDGIPVVPWHPYTYDSQQAQPPLSSQPTELKIEIFPTSLVLQKDHRLRLSITTGDLPHQGPNLSTLTNSLGGVDTIYFGGSTPSSVYIGQVRPQQPESAEGNSAGVSGSATGGVQAASTGLPFTATEQVGGQWTRDGLVIAIGSLLLMLAVIAATRRGRRRS
jgi:putative CocE/NonD family hydrolase